MCVCGGGGGPNVPDQDVQATVCEPLLLVVQKPGEVDLNGLHFSYRKCKGSPKAEQLNT